MVETARLQIVPLTHDQLINYIRHNPLTEPGLDLAVYMLPRITNARTDFRLVTLWSILLKDEQVAIGSLFFKGEPDEKGEIEIGYGTYERYRQKGYMTEAIGGMLAWARQQKGVRTIMAETAITNAASIKALLNNGFVIDKEKDGSVWLKARVGRFK